MFLHSFMINYKRKIVCSIIFEKLRRLKKKLFPSHGGPPSPNCEKNKLTVSVHFSRTPLEIFDIVREIAAPLT
jgi:hypothetical protein